MKICIVDDSIAFRKGLKILLTEKLNFQVIGEAGNGIEALRLPNLHQADIVILDIQMNEMDGFETAKRLLWLKPDLKIIALSMHEELVFLTKLVQSGFKAYVPKQDYYIKLPLAIQATMNGKTFFPGDVKF